MLYVIFFIFAIYTQTKHKNKKFIGTYAFIIYLISHFILIGYRDYSSGTDTISYLNMYAAVRSDKYLPSTEIAYIFLLKVFSFFSLENRGFILSTALIFNLFLIYIYKKFNYSTGLLVIFGLVSGTTLLDLETNGLRQGLAIGLAALAILYFRGWHATLILLTAGLIHYSALIIIIFYLLSELPLLSKKRYTYALSIIVFIILFMALLGINLISFKSFTPIVLDSDIFEKFNRYNDNSLPGNFEALSFFGRLPFFLTSSAIIFIYLWKDHEPNFIRVYLVFLFSIIFYYITASMAYSYRWMYFSLFISPILVGLFLDELNSNKLRTRISTLLLFLFFFWGTYSIWLAHIFKWQKNYLIQVF